MKRAVGGSGREGRGKTDSGGSGREGRGKTGSGGLRKGRKDQHKLHNKREVHSHLGRTHCSWRP